MKEDRAKAIWSGVRLRQRFKTPVQPYFPDQNNLTLDQILDGSAFLSAISLQFLSIRGSGSNQIRSNLTGPSIHCTRTLSLDVPRRNLTDLTWLIFAPVTASYLAIQSSTQGSWSSQDTRLETSTAYAEIPLLHERPGYPSYTTTTAVKAQELI